MANALETASSPKALKAAWDRKRKRLLGSCFGVDRVPGVKFQKSLQANLERVSRELKNGYEPAGLLAIPKPKDGGGHRIICVPTITDRLVQFSILEQLRPTLRRSGLDNPISYGLVSSRPRSVIGARNFACEMRGKHPWVYKTDIHKFFDTVDRALLRKAIRRVVSLRSLHGLLDRLLDSEIADGIEPGWKRVVAQAGLEPGLGVRQGMPLSPFFAAAYLRELDRWLLRRGLPAARYVDDIVVFFDTEKEAKAFHPQLDRQMGRLGLSVGALDAPGSKTKLYAPEVPADFLGMEIRRTDGRYSLCISQATHEKIGEKFARIASISNLTEQGVRLTTLGTYLNVVRCGYLNAYDGASNWEEFRDYIDHLCAGSNEFILRELFGDKLEAMTVAERKVVGIQ